MTMPHLENCRHSEDGWCLDCVKQQWQELDACKEHEKNHPGMSLRDYFAGQALAGILTHRDAFEDSGESDVARMAYDQADAMLAVRAKHSSEEQVRNDQ